jgi:two-component system, chemotaxis family, protein-glutamate methylesterase/glutaminase
MKTPLRRGGNRSKAVAEPPPYTAEGSSQRAYLDRRFDVVAVGASAGGLHSIQELLKPLPAEFPCSILIVQHLAPKHKSHLSELVGHVTSLRVKQAEHGEVLLPGVIYVAPPDEHLLLGPGKVQLAHTQLVHFLRPSIDLLFESVAGMYGSRAVGIVLSGSLRDGASGIRTIKQAGGTTFCQDPGDAQFRSMPAAAVATGCVDYVMPLAELGPALAKLCVGEIGRNGR